MAKKINFSQERLDKTTCPDGRERVYIYDSRTPGLALCVTSAGSKVFYVYRWNASTGQPIRVRLGGYPDLSVEQARKLAIQAVAEIAQGKDPGERRRKARGEMTLAELFGLYLENHAKPHKRSWQGDQEQYDLYLKPWAGRKLSAIRKADVAALHARAGRKTTRTLEAVKTIDGQERKRTWKAEAGGPYSANRLLALLSMMFNYAASLGYDGGNPTKGVKRFKEQSRDRFLHGDEIRAFFAALADAKTPELWRDFFKVTLLTGARRANVQAMKWADLELTRGLWRIPEAESKNKKPLICVLAPAAVEILQRRADNNAVQAPDKQSEFVFPGHGETGHVIDPAKPWQDILKRAKIGNLRLHDLRRTLGSWQAASGASLSIIGRSLGHKNVATTAIYARLDLDPVRASVNTAAAAIMAAANGDPAKSEQKQLPAPADARS